MRFSPLFPSAGILAICLILNAAPAQEPARPADADQALVDKTCATCHEVERVMAVTQSEQEWIGVIDRMIGYGAVIDDRTKQRIAHYLGARS